MLLWPHLCDGTVFDFGHLAIIAHHWVGLPALGRHPFAVGLPFTPGCLAGVAPSRSTMCDRSRGRGPYPELACGRQVGGVSTSQRRPGQAPVSSTAPERRCRADESGPNRGCSAVPNAHSTAVPVPSRSATKLRRWWRAAEIASASSCVCNAGKSPCSTTMLEAPSATTRSAAVMAVFSGSGSSSGVGSASTSAPSPAAAAAAASSG